MSLRLSKSSTKFKPSFKPKPKPPSSSSSQQQQHRKPPSSSSTSTPNLPPPSSSSFLPDSQSQWDFEQAGTRDGVDDQNVGHGTSMPGENNPGQEESEGIQNQMDKTRGCIGTEPSPMDPAFLAEIRNALPPETQTPPDPPGVQNDHDENVSHFRSSPVSPQDPTAAAAEGLAELWTANTAPSANPDATILEAANTLDNVRVREEERQDEEETALIPVEENGNEMGISGNLEGEVSRRGRRGRGRVRGDGKGGSGRGRKRKATDDTAGENFEDDDVPVRKKSRGNSGRGRGRGGAKGKERASNSGEKGGDILVDDEVQDENNNPPTESRRRPRRAAAEKGREEMLKGSLALGGNGVEGGSDTDLTEGGFDDDVADSDVIDPELETERAKSYKRKGKEKEKEKDMREEEDDEHDNENHQKPAEKEDNLDDEGNKKKRGRKRKEGSAKPRQPRKRKKTNDGGLENEGQEGEGVNGNGNGNGDGEEQHDVAVPPKRRKPPRQRQKKTTAQEESGETREGENDEQEQPKSKPKRKRGPKKKVKAGTGEEGGDLVQDGSDRTKQATQQEDKEEAELQFSDDPSSLPIKIKTPKLNRFKKRNTKAHKKPPEFLTGDLDPLSTLMSAICDDTGQGRVSTRLEELESKHKEIKKKRDEARKRMKEKINKRKEGGAGADDSGKEEEEILEGEGEGVGEGEGEDEGEGVGEGEGEGRDEGEGVEGEYLFNGEDQPAEGLEGEQEPDIDIIGGKDGEGSDLDLGFGGVNDDDEGSRLSPNSGLDPTATAGATFDEDEEFGETHYVPQMRLVNGELVIDEQSLRVDRSADPRARMQAPTETVYEEVGDRFVNSATYGKRQRAERWTVEDTIMFYDALRQFGTDFEMIARIFPGRNRNQIKKKWRKEEKLNPEALTQALKSKKKIDMEFYAKMTGQDFSGPMPEDPVQKLEEERLELSKKEEEGFEGIGDLGDGDGEDQDAGIDGAAAVEEDEEIEEVVREEQEEGARGETENPPGDDEGEANGELEVGREDQPGSGPENRDEDSDGEDAAEAQGGESVEGDVDHQEILESSPVRERGEGASGANGEIQPIAIEDKAEDEQNDIDNISAPGELEGNDGEVKTS